MDAFPSGAATARSYQRMPVLDVASLDEGLAEQLRDGAALAPLLSELLLELGQVGELLRDVGALKLRLGR